MKGRIGKSKTLKICSVSAIVVTLILPAAARALETVSGKSQLVDRPRRVLLVNLTLKTMPDATREVAEQLEIMPLLSELYNSDQPPAAERKVVLRQKILETILESYFDAASVQAEADREGLRLQALRETLTSKRDHNIEINNATNFIASGALNTVGSILGFTNRLPPFPGNVNQMLSGVVSATMSTYALKQNQGGKIHGQDNPTILAELFGRPINDRTTYPESVWRFLHGTSIDEPDKSRLQVMENHWIQAEHLEKHGSKKERQKIDLVCGVGGKHRSMTLDDLSDEIAMISDISAATELMSHHLRDLLRMIDTDVID